MAKNENLYLTDTARIGSVSVPASGGTNFVTVFTAGADGSKLYLIDAAQTVASADSPQLAIDTGSGDEVLGSFVQSGLTAGDKILEQCMTMLTDRNSNKYINLPPNADVKVDLAGTGSCNLRYYAEDY